LFCPKCGDEFRPGFAVCPDCEVALVTRRREHEESSVAELVTIATFENNVDASVAKVRLKLRESLHSPRVRI
jgi:uncharacterized Zn finger protein (UPF0148 family)